MVKTDYKKLLKNWRIILLFVSLALALILIYNTGLSYGMDFAGGYEMQLELDWKGVNESNRNVDLVRSILEERLNTFGLKNVMVRSWGGNEHMQIRVTNASQSDIKKIKDILNQQAKFEERIDGALAVKGDEISIELGAQGSRITPTKGGGYEWGISVKHNRDGACRFGEVGKGKMGRPVDTFIDRPENTVILMTKDTYGFLSNDYDDFGDSDIDIIKKRANISFVVIGGIGGNVSKGVENETLNETGNNISKKTELANIPESGDTYLEELEKYKSGGIVNVIIAGNDKEISEEIRNKLEEKGFNTERIEYKGFEVETQGEWIARMIGLKNSPRLNFNPQECQYGAEITGGAANEQEANDELKRIRALLSAGNLPAKTKIASESLVDPRHGALFLKYCFYAGLFSIVVVSLVIFLRYKKMFIVIPVMVTCISEVILILGLASAVSWELDLLAVAGIIAAVGTGVDNQIVITDETLKRRKGEKERVVSFTEQIGRAFFIIFTSAATIIAAMIPLFAIGAGMLKGFAFTTIMGVLFGVFITRPAFAATIEFLLKR